MIKNIKIIGYFDHCNLGDEQYKTTYNYIFSKYVKNYTDTSYNIDFIDCDKLHTYNINDDDIILIGGGDILNDYFLDKIIAKFTSKKNKIIALSVGLPFTSTLINTNKLNIIDYIFIRTLQDIELFKRYFDKNKIFYLPDISYFLKYTTLTNQQSDNNITYQSRLDELISLKSQQKKLIFISLSRHIYNKNYSYLYDKILHKFANFIINLIDLNFHIVFVAFNTNYTNSSENDVLINNDIKYILNTQYSYSEKNITFINDSFLPNQVLELYKYADISIPMRFHATLFSIYNSIPIFPIFSTRKIRNLLLDINWKYGYEFNVNQKFLPVDIELDILMSRFELFLYKSFTSNELKCNLIDINKNLFEKNILSNIIKMINIIDGDYIKSNNYKDKNQGIIDNTYKLIQSLAVERGYEDYRLITDEHLQSLIVNIIAYHLTNGSVNSIYNYGLQSKIFDLENFPTYDYNAEWLWILNDYNNKTSKNKLFSNPFGLFNLGYIDQVDYSGSHRSGWQYVYDNIKYLHKDDSDLLLDLYIDRTFHWNKELSKLLNIIPYKKNWIGFLHHTFDTSFSDYNCYKLLECQEFIDSLAFCKGIFVLSYDLKTKLLNEFQQMNINVPVFKLVHPSEDKVQTFNYKKFMTNKDKKLIHIGGWLRNVYSFYNLCLPKEITFTQKSLLCGKIGVTFSKQLDKLRKVALKGKNMNNYYPASDFLDNLHHILLNKNDRLVKNINLFESLKPITKELHHHHHNHHSDSDSDSSESEHRCHHHHCRHHHHHHHDHDHTHNHITPNNPNNLQNISQNNYEIDDFSIYYNNLINKKKYRSLNLKNISHHEATNDSIKLNFHELNNFFEKIESYINYYIGIFKNHRRHSKHHKEIDISVNVSQNVSQNEQSEDYENIQIIKNNWYKHFYDDMTKKIGSVDFIEFLNNEEYDTLLTENIVFINLVDASAVNTLIECILRNTPIIVNKHPAVVELLGEKYPLYFENNATDVEINISVHRLFKDPLIIKKAHKYLKHLDKSIYHINYFVSHFANIICMLKFLDN